MENYYYYYVTLLVILIISILTFIVFFSRENLEDSNNIGYKIGKILILSVIYLIFFEIQRHNISHKIQGSSSIKSSSYASTYPSVKPQRTKRSKGQRSRPSTLQRTQGKIMSSQISTKSAQISQKSKTPQILQEKPKIEKKSRKKSPKAIPQESPESSIEEKYTESPKPPEKSEFTPSEFTQKKQTPEITGKSTLQEIDLNIIDKNMKKAISIPSVKEKIKIYKEETVKILEKIKADNTKSCENFEKYWKDIKNYNSISENKISKTTSLEDTIEKGTVVKRQNINDDVIESLYEYLKKEYGISEKNITLDKIYQIFYIDFFVNNRNVLTLAFHIGSFDHIKNINPNKKAAIVNAANDNFVYGLGIAGVISKMLGDKKIESERESTNKKKQILKDFQKEDLFPGISILTSSYNLKKENIDFIIQAVGPNKSQLERIICTYRSIVKLMKEFEINIIYLPYISTGLFVDEKIKDAWILYCIASLVFVIYDFISELNAELNNTPYEINVIGINFEFTIMSLIALKTIIEKNKDQIKYNFYSLRTK